MSSQRPKTAEAADQLPEASLADVMNAPLELDPIRGDDIVTFAGAENCVYQIAKLNGQYVKVRQPALGCGTSAEPVPHQGGTSDGRKIVIRTCGECPNSDRTGTFTPGGAYPICKASEGKGGDHPGYPGSKSILPWLPARAAGAKKGMVARRATGVIPDWCPLPENRG